MAGVRQSLVIAAVAYLVAGVLAAPVHAAVQGAAPYSAALAAGDASCDAAVPPATVNARAAAASWQGGPLQPLPPASALFAALATAPAITLTATVAAGPGAALLIGTAAARPSMHVMPKHHSLPPTVVHPEHLKTLSAAQIAATALAVGLAVFLIMAAQQYDSVATDAPQAPLQPQKPPRQYLPLLSRVGWYHLRPFLTLG